MPTPTDIEEEIAELARDITKVGYMAKSEARRRLRDAFTRQYEAGEKDILDKVEKKIDTTRRIMEGDHEYIDTCDLFRMIQKYRKQLKEKTNGK